MTSVSRPAPISHSPRHPAARWPLTTVMFWLGLLVVLALPVNASASIDTQNASAAAACSSAGLDPSEAPFADCVRSLQQSSAAN